MALRSWTAFSQHGRPVSRSNLVSNSAPDRHIPHQVVLPGGRNLSDARVPIESISRLVGHRSTTVTETIYRKQLRPVIEGGAEVMDRILPGWSPREP